MIRNFILPLIAVVLLSSCANQISVVKRKYNKGYYLDLGHKKTTPKNNDLAQVKQKKSSLVQSEEPAAEEIATSLSPSKNEVKTAVLVQKSNNTVLSKERRLTASSEKKTVSASPVFKPAEVKPVKTVLSSKKGKADSDLIIQIILALFPILCLIAVYLHDGKKITLNFWVDLILHITFLGEIIFALLVVLDVIDLA